MEKSATRSKNQKIKKKCDHIEPANREFHGWDSSDASKENDANSGQQRTSNLSVLASIIKGCIENEDGDGILSPQVVDILKPIYVRAERLEDQHLMWLCIQAIDTYQAAMMEATKHLFDQPKEQKPKCRKNSK